MKKYKVTISPRPVTPREYIVIANSPGDAWDQALDDLECNGFYGLIAFECKELDTLDRDIKRGC